MKETDRFTAVEYKICRCRTGKGKRDLSQPLELLYMARVCTAGAAESSFTSALQIQVTEILII